MKKLFLVLAFFSSMTAFAQSYECDFIKNVSEEIIDGADDIVLRDQVISVGTTSNFNLSNNRLITVDLYKTDDGKLLRLLVLFYSDSNSPYPSGQIYAHIPSSQSDFLFSTSYDMPAPDFYHAQNLFVGCEML